MTRVESAGVLSALLHYGRSNGTLSQQQQDALEIAIDWLTPMEISHNADLLVSATLEIKKEREVLRKQQLGNNGLAPCGCGGRAVMRKYKCHSGEDVWSVMCDKCQVGTAECFLESFARNDWNNAMGVGV